MEAVRYFSLFALHQLMVCESQVWTRFQPVSYKVQEVLRSGAIGELRSVQAELNVDFQPEKSDQKHRMVNPDLAGGALLDLGHVLFFLALSLPH